MTIATNDTSDAEAARLLIDRQLLDLRTAIPGVVVAVGAGGTTVDVQPAVSMTQTLDGEARGVAMPVLTGVPLQVLGSTGGNLFVIVPVQPGDEGLLVVCDRALDNWQYGAGVSPAPIGPSPRHHDLTDAVFIPGLQRMSGKIPLFPTASVQIRNRNGTVMAEITDDTIRLIAPTVQVLGNLTATGTITDGTGRVLGTHVHGGVDAGPDFTGPPA